MKRKDKARIGVIRRLALLLVILNCVPAYSTRAQNVMFDFDTGAPALTIGQHTPFDQTSGGGTAHFSSPSDIAGLGAFSVQDEVSTHFTLSQFSGKFLYPNTMNRTALDIKFSRMLSSITLTFATVDYQYNAEVPANLLLTAYENSTANPEVGSATAHGRYAGDTYPQAVLTFDAGSKAFNLVRIIVPAQPQGTTTFLLDTITVAIAPLQTGSLAVTITPGEAITAGAQWRRVGTIAWLNSGTTETAIPTGAQVVEFKPVAGWTTPANQGVTISNGQTSQITGSYVRQTGALRVSIFPGAATAAGAQWRRAGTTAWRAGEATETDVPTGICAVEFKPLTGWTTPASKSVTISHMQTAQTSGTYVRQTGSLKVTIRPDQALASGAKWRRMGTTAWLNSDATETGVPTGSVTVEFKPISNWRPPGGAVVMISNGQITQVVKSYSPMNSAVDAKSWTLY